MTHRTDPPVSPRVLRRAVGAELRRRGAVQSDREIAPAARAAGILFLPQTAAGFDPIIFQTGGAKEKDRPAVAFAEPHDETRVSLFHHFDAHQPPAAFPAQVNKLCVSAGFSYAG